MYKAAFVAMGIFALGNGSAAAAPLTPANPVGDNRLVQKTQEFGIYIGPRYGYRDRYWDYGYGYNPNYYYGPPRRYYRDYGYSAPYRWEHRPFRRLQRKAP